MQNKIYLSIARAEMTGNGFVHLQGEFHILCQLDHIPEISGMEREMAHLWRQADRFRTHKDQQGAIQEDSRSGCSDLHEQ